MSSNLNKYNKAWIKLIEFISQKEKNYAYGIYRLLSANLEDQALAYKLEGDINLFFKNKREALNSYLKSKDLYQFQKKYKESAAIDKCIGYIRHSKSGNYI